MDLGLKQYYHQAKHTLHAQKVGDLYFSGSTFQVEVFDQNRNEIFWPLLHLEPQGGIKDAFCSCTQEVDLSGPCPHLLAAYLKIMGEEHVPLHIRFEKSFWNALCKLAGYHTGYDEKFLVKEGEGAYSYHNEIYFHISATDKQGIEKLTHLVEKRVKETPDNSIKFSDISQEEINWWREGRPSVSLRYTLSFWSDLAKWMLLMNKKGEVHFEEDREGLPTRIIIQFPSLMVRFEIKKKDLPNLIPSIETVKSNLKILYSTQDEIKEIRFDPKEQVFLISHAPLSAIASLVDLDNSLNRVEAWAYLPGLGFYKKEKASLLSRSVIDKEAIPQFLTEHFSKVSDFIPIYPQPVPLSYTMFFDPQWNWHFTAFLFDEGDLAEEKTFFFKEWVFVEGKGFFKVEDSFFGAISATVPSHQVSHFINHHRIWLNGQAGFQTHLASVESHLSYLVSAANTLSFFQKTEMLSTDSMDFGDWIYYAGQGFFSKRHVRLGLVVRPGLIVQESDISGFIKTNREELEAIPHFFTLLLPLEARWLVLTVSSSTSLHVKPVYTLQSSFSHTEVKFFGDFIYIPGEGFNELPLTMRLPEAYEHPVTLEGEALHHFLEIDLPHLKKYIPDLPPQLTVPHKLNLSLHYLVRSSKGGLKAHIFYHTELGKVALIELLTALREKRRYVFSEAGLLDLQSSDFQWIRSLKETPQREDQTIEISIMDFIRLDNTLGFLGPTGDSPAENISRHVMQELREFSAHDMPETQGLKSELRLYQKTGLQWLWFLYKNNLSGLLCDDMGLGKTHQAMALIAATLNYKTQGKKRYLVVCPTSVIYHWQDKLEIFLPHVKVHVFHGIKRTLNELPHEGLILTSYGILRSERKRMGEISFEVAIFDEIQIAKNPQSRVHEALKRIKARMKLGLTGTPIENNLRELKALFDLVLPGYLPSQERFKELFINPIERHMDDEKKGLLSKVIQPFVLRRRKAEVLQELPDKTENKSYCQLTLDQHKLYQETLALNQKQLLSELRDVNLPVNYIHIFSILSRLKQVCDHPALLHKTPEAYKSYSSGKWELFIELLEEARESDQKVVIFSQFLHMLDIFALYLQERGWGYAQIRGNTLNRKEELKRFQEEPSCVVFLGSLQAAGLGIDLTAASVVILYDRWWNAARENQAIDRVHRIGQKWGVQVYKLITKDTIEEKIDLMITRKGRLLEEIVASDDQTVVKKFTRAELIELFS